jgi:hypothetical protein
MYVDVNIYVYTYIYLHVRNKRSGSALLFFPLGSHFPSGKRNFHLPGLFNSIFHP